MRYIGRFFGWIFSALVLAAIMGVIVVGGVVWSYSKDLPDTQELSDYRPTTLSRVYSGEGRLLDEYVRERRIFVPFDEIPPTVWQAFVAAEDGAFFEHPGFDAVGIVSAGLDAARGGRLRGASTITQQVVKNFLLDGRREVERKIQEVILAVRLESLLTKEQILELYLNEIFLGENSFGIVAAAANYFGKSLEELTPEEAAYLASLPKAPSNRHPVRDRETALFWRNNTLRLMGEQGYLTPEEVTAAQEAPLLSVQNGDYEPVSSTRPGRDYFSEEIRRQMSDRFGADELMAGGLTIRATVEPQIQEAAAAALRGQLVAYDRDRLGYRGPLDNVAEQLAEDGADWRRVLRSTRGVRDVPEFHMAVVLALEEDAAVIGIEGMADPADGQHRLYVSDFQWARPRLEGTNMGPAPDSPDDILAVGDVILVQQGTNEDGTFSNWNLRQVPELQGAFMVMDHRTGRVLAMQGGFSYDASSFNRATQATRQPGSAFKPFVFAAALDAGMTPNSIILDAPFTLEQPGQPTWRPKNYSGEDSFNGPTLMRVGLERSLNLMTVRIADDVGMDVIADYAESFGIYDDMGEFLPMSLGAGETTLFRMISAYAMFANGGQRVEPTLVDRVQDRFGNTIYRHDQRGCEGCEDVTYDNQPEPHIYSTAERTMSRITAFRLISMLEGVVDRGTARSLADLPVPLAGKTGTTNESRDAWFIGFTPDIVAGCYIGFDTPRSMGRGGTGGSMCGPVFRAFMEDYLEINPADPGRFQPPEGVDVIKMDRTSGVRLPDDTNSGDWVYEVFPLGEAPAVAVAAVQRGVESSGSGRSFNLSDLPQTVQNDVYVPPSNNNSDVFNGGGSVTVRRNDGGGTVAVPAPPSNLDDLGSGGLY